MSHIGFIGLGIMGKPMSKNLLKAGHTLVVYDVVPGPLAEVIEAGAARGESASDTASRSELVVPLVKNGVLVGVLDLDSPSIARFDEADRAGCESVAAVFLAR